jgi:hypothetical protein
VVTVFRMSEQVSSQPPDHEPEAQPAADERQADHPADEPQAEAGKREPETPKPRWWRFWRRQSEQRGRPESRFSVLTALISAAAALIGATVGGIASYEAAQSQATAQFRVAKANNGAQANQALITRRQTAYSDFISSETDLQDAEFRLLDAIVDFRPPNIDRVVAVFKQENAAHIKWMHEVANVQIVGSTEANLSLNAIIGRQADLSQTISIFVNQVQYQMMPVDDSADHKFFTNIKGLDELTPQFINAAKRDIEGVGNG